MIAVLAQHIIDDFFVRVTNILHHAIADVPADPVREKGQSAVDYSASVLAAMIKSFLWRPSILCVHQLIVTFPHSVKMSG